jgi:hypothetical protein
MKKFLNLSKWIFPVLIPGILTSCEKDDNTGPDYNTSFRVESAFNGTALKKSAVSKGELMLDEVSIVISEIEVEYDDDDPGRDEDKWFDLKLDGPFEINILDNGESLDQVLANVSLPEAEYDEIEFEMEPGEDPSSALFGKTILAEGTINGVPFVFWRDDSEDFEIEFEDAGILTVDGIREAAITLFIDLNNVFDYSISGIDLTLLNDNDGDGLIEIFPGSDDGYSELADELWERFEDSIDAYEEEYDDDEDDHDDEDDDYDDDDDDK